MPYSTALDISVRFSAPVTRVWSAMTDPDELSSWWPGTILQPREGGNVRFVTERSHKKRDRTLSGTIKHFDRLDRIVISAHSHPREFDSKVTLLFSQLKNKSRLRVIEEGKKKNTLDGVIVSEARDGWRVVLSALEHYLETT